MGTHQLKIAFRHLYKHRSNFLINFIGLTTGLTSVFFIYFWVKDELNFDKFHEKDARLYRVMEYQTYSNERYATRSTPGILSENLKKDFPEIEYAATTTWINFRMQN